MKDRSRRPIAAVALSGGGSRAYIAGLAQLAALEDLGLLSSVDHVASVSGGAWAMAVHAWGSSCARQPSLRPESLTWRALRHMPADVPHGALTRVSLVRQFARRLVAGRKPPYEAWRGALWETILQPLGIPEGASFPWSAGQPQAKLPPPSASFTPHFVATLQGPQSLAPFELAQRSFGCLDLSPSEARCAPATERTYSGRPGGPSTPLATRSMRLSRRSLLHLPAPATASRMGAPFTLADALAATSFFPGAYLASAAQGRGWRWRRWAGRQWRCALEGSSLLAVGDEDTLEDTPPSDVDEPADAFLLADGASVANIALPLLLAAPARATRVLALFNVGEALPTRAQWAPSARLPPPCDAFAISEDLAALFGILPSTPNPHKDLSRSQCFEPREFARTMRSLQRGMESGRGAVATTRLRTIANPWWGLPAGTEVTVCWAYMSRVPVWEERLPPDVRGALAPLSTTTGSVLGGDASRASAFQIVRTLAAEALRPWRRHRPLDSLPQLPLMRLRPSAEEANALYQQSGWVMHEHAEQLRALLAG